MKSRLAIRFQSVFLLLVSIVLPASAATVPAISTNTNLIKNGDVVYFGRSNNYNQLCPWLVLSDGNDAKLATSGKGEALLYANLISAQGYKNFSKEDDKYNSAWADSYAKEYCESFYTNWDNPIEKAAIASTSAKETVFVTVTAENLTFSPVSLTGEHIFFLSVYEATQYFKNDEDRILIHYTGMPQQYWFRSPTTNGAWIAINAAYTGRITFKEPSNSSGMRMALNLDLSRVFAISSATEGKPSGTDGVLMPIGTNETGEWKLTLKDDERNFTATAAEGAVLNRSVGYRGWMVDVAYSGAKSGDNECISAILLNSSGQALYYGSVSAQTDGIATFIMPQGLKKGTYTLMICSEQKNADLQSDYSSDYKSIKLTISSGGSADQQNFTLPEEIESIAPGTFEGIAARIVIIPDGCESIGSRAFANCRNLTQVYIPASVKSDEDIAADAFAGCGHLYLYGVPGGAAQAYCNNSEHANCTFVPEE